MPASLSEPLVAEPTLAPAEHRIELAMNEQGMICSCDIPAGYRCDKLPWRHISELLPELAGVGLMRGGQINPRLRFLSRIGHRFQLAGLGEKCFEGWLFLHDTENSGQHYLRALVFPVEDELDAVPISSLHQ